MPTACAAALTDRVCASQPMNSACRSGV